MNQAVVGRTPRICGRRKKPLAEWFLPIAGAILAITGIAKCWSGLAKTKLLVVADPIIGLKFGDLILAVGFMEVVIALVCLFNKRQTLGFALVAWISTNFAAYRLGLWWIDWKSPCGCLGNLTDALHISPQIADNSMKVLLAYLLIGSYTLLFLNLRQKRSVREEVETVVNRV